MCSSDLHLEAPKSRSHTHPRTENEETQRWVVGAAETTHHCTEKRNNAFAALNNSTDTRNAAEPFEQELQQLQLQQQQQNLWSDDRVLGCYPLYRLSLSLLNFGVALLANSLKKSNFFAAVAVAVVAAAAAVVAALEAAVG